MTVPLPRWTDRLQQVLARVGSNMSPVPVAPDAAPSDRTPWRPSVVFIAAGLPFALAMLVLTPPFQVPDEPAHFFRAYMISEGRLLGEPIQGGSGGVLPSSLQRVSVEVRGDVVFHAHVKQDREVLLQHLDTPLNPDERVETEFAGATVYFPLVYLPQALGIAAGRLFEASPLVLMYLARLFNALLSLALTALAIRIIPVHRWAMVALTLTPMVAFTRSSVSADAFTLSASFLLIAMLVRYALAVQRPLGRRDLAVIFALTVAVALTKQTYFVLAGCFLLLPKSLVGSWQRYSLVFIALIGSALIATAAWSASVSDLYRPIHPHTDMKGQIAFVLSNPLRTFGVLVGDLYEKRVLYLDMAIGRLGWLDTVMPRGALWTLFWMFSAIAMVDSHRRLSFSLKQRLVLGTTFIAAAVAIAGALYVSWTPPGAAEVMGIQGRYFLPLAPLAFLVFHNRGFATIRGSAIVKGGLVGAYICVSMATTVRMLLQRYWAIL